MEGKNKKFRRIGSAAEKLLKDTDASADKEQKM